MGKRTSAFAGSLLNIKPVLHVDDEGHLIPIDKVRGRKKAINYIVEHSAEAVVDQKESVGIILHADVPEEAKRLHELLSERLPEMTIRIDNIGPVIGAHCGPGTLAFCFMGKERDV